MPELAALLKASADESFPAPPFDDPNVLETLSSLGMRKSVTSAAVLDAADVAHDGPDEGAEALARKLVAALWWRSHSPVGHVLAPDSLGDLVGRSGKKLGIDLGAGDPWEQLAVLTDALVPSNRPIDLDALPESSRKRLRRGAWRELLGLSGVGSALGSRWASLRLLGLMQGPQDLPVALALADAELGQRLSVCESVVLIPSGAGTVEGSTLSPRIAWDQGSIDVEVEPGKNIDLAVLTRDAEVRVKGTVF